MALVRALLAARGLEARAEIAQLLDSCDGLIDVTGATSWTSLLHVERARLARRAGDDEDASRAFAAARAGFTAIGAHALAREAAAHASPRV